MSQIKMSELRAGLASGKITDADVVDLKANGFSVLNDEQTVPGPSGKAGEAFSEKANKIMQGGRFMGVGAPEVATGATKGVLGTGYQIAKMLGAVPENPDFEAFLKTKGPLEFAGKAIEQGAEFMGGEEIAKGALGLVEDLPVVGKVIEAAPKIIQGVGRAARRFGTGYGVARAQGATGPEAVAAGAVNSGLPAVLEAIGGVGKGIGEKILNSAIRPTATDIKDGYKTATIATEGLDTSNLATLHESIVARMNQLRQIARDIRASVGKSPNADILQQFIDAQSELLADPKYIGKYDAIKRVAGRYIDDLATKAPSGSMDVIEANSVKTGLGFAGEWSHGNAAPDSEAEALFATKAYKLLNQEIYDVVGNAAPRLRMLNQRMQDLIPVELAVARRIPVEARNNPLGLLKAVAISTGHYALFAADMAQRSVKVGGKVLRAGTAISSGAGAAGAVGAGTARTIQENETVQP